MSEAAMVKAGESEAGQGAHAAASETGAGASGGTIGMMESHAVWPMLSRLPVSLSASIPLRRFTVRELLAITVGQTVESAWPATDDVPLNAGDVQVSWCEFEVVETKMALRMTRLG